MRSVYEAEAVRLLVVLFLFVQQLRKNGVLLQTEAVRRTELSCVPSS